METHQSECNKRSDRASESLNMLEEDLQRNLAEAIKPNRLNALLNGGGLGEVDNPKPKAGTPHTGDEATNNKHLVRAKNISFLRLAGACACIQAETVNNISNNVENERDENGPPKTDFVREITKNRHENKLCEIIAAKHEAVKR
jgi:hypothetical protein